MPLSVKVEAGRPFSVAVVVKLLVTIGVVIRAWAVQCRSAREWSSSQEMVSTSLPSARCQWVKSDCQVSLGWAASKR